MYGLSGSAKLLVNTSYTLWFPDDVQLVWNLFFPSVQEILAENFLKPRTMQRLYPTYKYVWMYNAYYCLLLLLGFNQTPIIIIINNFGAIITLMIKNIKLAITVVMNGYKMIHSWNKEWFVLA
jgi:hypothetical protein